MPHKINNKDLQESINRIASTTDGKILFAYLKSYCNFDVTLIDNDPVKNGFNLGVRSVYTHIRTGVKPDYLKQIEHDYEVDYAPEKRKISKDDK